MKYLPLVLILFVLAAAAAAGWFLFRTGEAELEFERAGSMADERAEEDVAEIPRREPGRVDPGAIQPSVVDAEGPEAPLEPAYREQPEGGVLVSVVAAESKEPVPEIDVYLVTESMVPRSAMMMRRSPFEMLAKYGHRYRADHDGKLRVARMEERCTLLALAPGLWGQRSFRSGDAEVTIEVRTMPAVDVRVVDEAGRPVTEAAVCWRVATRFAGRDRFVHDRFVELTRAPDGLARLHLPDDGRRRENDEHFVALQGAFAAPIQAAFDLDDLPTEPVTLVMPATGTLEVEVVAPEGAELPDEPFALLVRPLDPDRPDEDAIGMNDERSAQGMVVDGRLRLENIGLGLELGLVLRGLGTAEFEPLKQTIAGPKAVGEVVPVRFELPSAPTRCVVSGRFLDEEGRPIASSRFRGMSERRSENGSNSSGQGGQTDEEGRFRMAFDVIEVTEGLRWLVEFKVEKSGQPARRIEFDFGGRGIGEHDLGDVVLRPDPLLARGRVTGPDGEPHAGAWVSAIPVVEDPNAWRSHRYESSSARSDEEGAFELRGEIDSSEIQLSASAGGFVADPMNVVRGATGVEIQLRALATFQVKVVAEGDGGLDGLQASLTAEEQEYFGGGNQLLDDGRFETQVEAGRYDFRIASPGKPGQVLFESKGLVLEAGRTLDLGEVAIRHSGKMIQLMIDPGEGAEDFLWGDFRVYSPGGSEVLIEANEAIYGEPVKLFVPSLPVEVEVAVPGYRVRRYPVRGPKSKIKLDPGIDVRVRVAGLGGYAEDVIASLDIYDADARSGRRGNFSVNFKPNDGEATFRVSKPGRYQLNFMIGLQYEGGSSLSGVQMKEPPIIEVKESSSLQTFTVSPDREALDRELKNMRQGH